MFRIEMEYTQEKEKENDKKTHAERTKCGKRRGSRGRARTPYTMSLHIHNVYMRDSHANGNVTRAGKVRTHRRTGEHNVIVNMSTNGWICAGTQFQHRITCVCRWSERGSTPVPAVAAAAAPERVLHRTHRPHTHMHLCERMCGDRSSSFSLCNNRIQFRAIPLCKTCETASLHTRAATRCTRNVSPAPLYGWMSQCECVVFSQLIPQMH